jgi:hypothetical protein
LEIFVHQVNTRKVCFGIEFIGTDDLNHPVEHPRPQALVDVVLIEEGSQHLFASLGLLNDVGGIEKAILLSVAEMFIDRFKFIFDDFFLNALGDSPNILTILEDFELLEFLGVFIIMVNSLDHEKAIHFIERFTVLLIDIFIIVLLAQVHCSFFVVVHADAK